MTPALSRPIPASPNPSQAPAPLRVVFTDHTAQLGGAELALLRILRKLPTTLVSPSVVLFQDGPLRHAMLDSGIACSVFPAPGDLLDVRKESVTGAAFSKLSRLGASAGFVRSLARHLSTLAPDVVATNSMKAHLLAGFAAKSAGLPLLWYLHDRVADDYLPRAAVRAVRLAASSLPTLVVANSLASLATLSPRLADRAAHAWQVAHLPGPPGVIPPGVESVRPDPRTHLPPVVGIVGRLTPWKGQDVFLRAARLVLDRRPDARFLVIGAALFGEQPFADSLHHLASTLGLSHAVEFTGFVSQPQALYDRLGVLVHASTVPEPFGQVVLEGMASGVAVVAAAAGGVLEIAQHARTALLTPPGDATALAAAILRLLDDPPFALALADRGRQSANHFLGSHTALQLAAALQAVPHLHATA